MGRRVILPSSPLFDIHSVHLDFPSLFSIIFINIIDSKLEVDISSVALNQTDEILLLEGASLSSKASLGKTASLPFLISPSLPPLFIGNISIVDSQNRGFCTAVNYTESYFSVLSSSLVAFHDMTKGLYPLSSKWYRACRWFSRVTRGTVSSGSSLRKHTWSKLSLSRHLFCFFLYIFYFFFTWASLLLPSYDIDSFRKFYYSFSASGHCLFFTDAVLLQYYWYMIIDVPNWCTDYYQRRVFRVNVLSLVGKSHFRGHAEQFCVARTKLPVTSRSDGP